REPVDGRLVDLPVDRHPGPHRDLVGLLDRPGPEVLELVAGDGRGVADLHGQLALDVVAAGGGHADGDEHDAEVDDHAAVGAADEPPPALAAGGQHDLAHGGPGREPAETEGQQRDQAPGPDGDGDDDG